MFTTIFEHSKSDVAQINNSGLLQFVFACFAVARWFTMTHAEEVQATGTAFSGLNIWPQGAIWLLRWVRCVSACLLLYFDLQLSLCTPATLSWASRTIL